MGDSFRRNEEPHGKKKIFHCLGLIPVGKYSNLARRFFFKVGILVMSYLQK